MGWFDYKPYVPVAERRAQAAKEVAKRLKNGQTIWPVRIEGRKIATTFWGLAWCTNLEAYSDFESRLPRGRTYVRNGSVVHLAIEKGRIKALVSGSELYDIQIDIVPVAKSHWEALKKRCAGRIGSLVELLQGKLSKDVMELVTDRAGGLFPSPKEIKMRCSCPDYAGMCKHLAAVMYGIGNRLDASPELLFLLRAVDHAELIEQAIPDAPRARGGARAIAGSDLGDIFGIEIDDEPAPAKPARKPTVKKVAAAPTPKKATASKVTPAKTTAAPKKAASSKATVAPKKAAAKAAPVKKAASSKPTVVARTTAAPAKKAAVKATRTAPIKKTTAARKKG